MSRDEFMDLVVAHFGDGWFTVGQLYAATRAPRGQLSTAAAWAAATGRLVRKPLAANPAVFEYRLS